MSADSLADDQLNEEEYGTCGECGEPMSQARKTSAHEPASGRSA